MPLVRKKRKRTQFSRPCTEAEEHFDQQRFLDPNKIEILVVILVLGCVIGLAFLFLFQGRESAMSRLVAPSDAAV
jgi:hypothetical protein